MPPHYADSSPAAPWMGNQPAEVTVNDLKTHLHQVSERTLLSRPDEYIVFFWASCARFTVHYDPPLATATFKSYYGYGTEELPKVLSVNKTVVGTLCRMSEGHWKNNPPDDTLEDFVAVGRRSVPEIPDYPAKILAMQIKRGDDGLAIRINMAEIEEQAWTTAERAWKLVALV